MEIVSTRMGRKFAQAEKNRKDIQPVFHMVNRGYHLLAIGWIQPDGTVKGGDGLGGRAGQIVQPPGQYIRSTASLLVRLARQPLGRRGA
jgi:hypothetical protein